MLTAITAVPLNVSINNSSPCQYFDTWILGVASKQLRLLHGRVGDSTIVVNSLIPQMSELVEDAIDS